MNFVTYQGFYFDPEYLDGFREFVADDSESYSLIYYKRYLIEKHDNFQFIKFADQEFIMSKVKSFQSVSGFRFDPEKIDGYREYSDQEENLSIIYYSGYSIEVDDDLHIIKWLDNNDIIKKKNLESVSGFRFDPIRLEGCLKEEENSSSVVYYSGYTVELQDNYHFITWFDKNFSKEEKQEETDKIPETETKPESRFKFNFK